MSSSRRRWLLAAKAVVSLALVGWLGSRMLERDGVDALLARLESVELGWLGVALALHFAAVLAGVTRWRLLLRAVRVELPLGWLARSYLIGRFIGAFTPSTTGLDGWRLYDAGRASGALARSGAAIGVEKLVGLIGMTLVCAALVPFGGVRLMGPSALYVAGALGVGAALGLFAIASPRLVARAVALTPRLVRGRMEKALEALEASRLSLGAVTRAVLLGVLAHLALSAVFAATAHALGVDVALSTLLVVGNAIVLAVLLPISVGGVGVREGVAVMLLAGAGVDGTDAVLIALLGYLTGQVPALLGGALMAIGAKSTAPALAPVEQTLA